MSIEAMKQALEALEAMQNAIYNIGGEHVIDLGYAVEKADVAQEAITSLRQAIAEAEKQEPYGYLKLSNGKFYHEVEGVPDLACNPDYLPLHTHPQPKQEPLTVEQIDDLHGEANRGFCIEREDYFKAFRDAETAHGIKGKA
jgi:hypothetical protein